MTANADSDRSGTTQHRPLTAERIRDLITLALDEHHDVRAVTTAHTTHVDRSALGVVDHDGMEWYVHILKDGRKVGDGS